jgi:endonuclease/exonuclease/phosphatase family metal-dependent hydrolase
MKKTKTLLIILFVLTPLYLFARTDFQRKEYRIATFNIQAFGQAKMRHPVVVPILLRIVSQFDLVAIQELRDKSQTTMPKFTALLNTGPHEYGYVTGPRLGRTHSKEQYVFLFRKNSFKALKIKTFPDSKDIFHREATGVLFEFRDYPHKFVILNFHVDPNDAEAEIANISRIIQWAKSEFGTENILVMGDFNSDCGYYDEEKWPENFRGAAIHWYFDHDTDTTLGGRSCTYDRIGSTGKIKEWFTRKKGVLRFDGAAFSIPPQISSAILEKYPEWAKILSRSATRFFYKGAERSLNAKRISDHFPLWIEVIPKERP